MLLGLDDVTGPLRDKLTKELDQRVQRRPMCVWSFGIIQEVENGIKVEKDENGSLPHTIYKIKHLNGLGNLMLKNKT